MLNFVNKLFGSSGKRILKQYEPIVNKINSLEKNKFYEINRDNIFLEEAKNNLTNNPFRYFSLFLKFNRS